MSSLDEVTRLARRARRGDAAALEHFVEATYDEVWRLCASLVAPESADDIAQEVFVRAVRALPGFRGEASARTWLLSIARRTCIDEIRAVTRRRRRTARSLVAGHEGGRGRAGGHDRGHADMPEPVQMDASHRAVWSDLVSRLEPDRRTAFVLTQILGLRYEEAARVCGCPTGTIRSRVSRARQDLIGLLGEGRAGPDPRVEQRPNSAS